MFHGVMTALITPFKIDEGGCSSIDRVAYCAHLDRQIAAGVSGLIPAGTTGEAATLSFDEHKALIELTVRHVAGRTAVIAGTGSNNTAESIALTEAAKKIGADAALLISPYYNKPMQEGIYQHYKAVADAVDLPQILYNVPSRTNSNLSPGTVARLSQLDNIVGIKDATADLAQLTRCKMLCSDDFEFYSGDDATVLPFMSLGGNGVISVVSNLAPRTMEKLTNSMSAGDLDSARQAHFALQNLTDALFVQSNPIPVKAACALMGWMHGELRLPLTPLTPDEENDLQAIMQSFHSEWETLQLAVPHS
ncbi:MAG: 4-hydroxy-tetrahydrodipicolinate synthase [Mariprofundaceae bacterium]|nr:4-hydroxy-tetrahydrodipicolinate synthase [Mariprofundaceae bacterium]